MSRIFICFSVVLTVFLFGCQGQQKTVNDPNMQVILIDTDKFPSELAGQWISDNSGWGIGIEKSGAIKFIIHPMGGAYIVPGQENTYPLIENGKGLVVPGKWSLQYTKKTREMVIEIILDSFLWMKGSDELEGQSRDVLYGTVSEDYKTWTATWDTFTEYHVNTATVKNYTLPMDEPLVGQGTFLFTKRKSQ